MFIAFEGIDGSGKTTAIGLLKEILEKNGIKTHLTSEPTTMESGVQIRKMLKKESSHPLFHKKLALMFAVDRLNHIENEIEVEEKKGKIVITDRYFFSSFAYQSLNVEKLWIYEINKFAKMPDLLIFMDIPVEEALKRINSSREETEIFEKKELLNKVKQNYEEVLEKFQTKLKIIKIDATKSIEEIKKDLKTVLKNF